MIVRGVKSGLPLNECLAVIGREAQEPVAGEFRELVEQQRVYFKTVKFFQEECVKNEKLSAALQEQSAADS